ncbi:MAG: glycine zipper 2TM domain-containing protein [Alphaproteobacteria bacterium]|nr:glycine zipper 2TM domain-containing protein [Alphaproteobacteria bacterium]
MLRKSAIALLTASLALAACQSDNWGNDQTVGTLGGAAAGGLLGSQFGHGSGKLVTTSLGVLLGAWAGNEVGASMDETDRLKNQTAERRAYTAPIGQQITWNDPKNGNAGTITPVRDGYASDGAYCREFQQTITIGGKRQQGYGKACQQPDGSWKIVQ